MKKKPIPTTTQIGNGDWQLENKIKSRWTVYYCIVA